MLVAAHLLDVDSGSEQVYNGMDCLLTHEIFATLGAQIPQAVPAYSFELALQAPVLEMMLRGFAVNPSARELGIQTVKKDLTRLEHIIITLASAVLDREVKERNPKGKLILPASAIKLKELFYDHLGVLPIKVWEKGELKFPMNRDVIEQIEDYFQARPIATAILVHRDKTKELQVLETEVDPDWRMRTSYNIGGTKSARFSSSKSPTGSGGNLQNVSDDLRHILISDPGYVLCGIDAEQSDSRMVGYMCGVLFDDWTYLDACECLTTGHEVLTNSGWVDISTMPIDEIAIWDQGVISFQKVFKWNKGNSSDLIEIENRSVSLLGTANHSMPILGSRSGLLEKRSLREIQEKPNFVAPNTGTYVGGNIYIKEAAIIAAFQADGTRDERGKVHWTFVKERKIWALETMLIEAGYDYSVYKLGSGATRFYLKANQGQENWPKVCGREILSWDIRSLREFCNSHFIWDAHVKGNAARIDAKDHEHLEWLAIAYTMCGKMTSINRTKDIYWRLTIKSNETHQYRSATFKNVSVAHEVFCPTVSSGFFLVRRNGRIFISGNSGDLHTFVARMTWPDDLPWTGDISKDRKIAEKSYYRHFSYRDCTKKLGHGTNFLGKAPTLSKLIHIPKALIIPFQEKYFEAFPAILKLHAWTASELQSKQQLTSIHGRKRDFFDRANADETIRKGLAFLAAAATADNLNLGMWKVWRFMPEVQLLAQVHDAIYFQFKETEDKATIIAKAQDLLTLPLRAKNGRRFVVPTEVKIGYNWGNYSETNTKGLKKFQP